ncbi:hypothetical protein MKW92_021295 [Papaver armeniacum]|nr:hypothetical protein MKW92_021295 [Papaver armeniacum]
MNPNFSSSTATRIRIELINITITLSPRDWTVWVKGFKASNQRVTLVMVEKAIKRILTFIAQFEFKKLN